jgi:hypothetical protein
MNAIKALVMKCTIGNIYNKNNVIRVWARFVIVFIDLFNFDCTNTEKMGYYFSMFNDKENEEYIKSKVGNQRAAVALPALFTALAAQLRSVKCGSPLPSTTILAGPLVFPSTFSTDLGDATIGDVAVEDAEADNSAASSLPVFTDVSQVMDAANRVIALRPIGARAAKVD